MLSTVKIIGLVSMLSFFVVSSKVVNADAIKGDAICSKIKTCALESIEEQQIPDQMVDILMTQLDAQCAGAFKSKEQEIVDAGLANAANACADSMVSLPCNELMTPNGKAKKTPACDTFEASAKKAGVEVN